MMGHYSIILFQHTTKFTLPHLIMNSQISLWFHRAAGDEIINATAHDMSNLCQSTEELDLRTGSCSDTHPTSTKVLYEGEGDQPTITLTAYKGLLLSPEQYLLQIFEPSNPGSVLAREADDKTFSSLTSALKSTSVSAHQDTPEMAQELDDHFRDLKSEFGEKTERSRAPLQA
jgi:hypothetical protein